METNDDLTADQKALLLAAAFNAMAKFAWSADATIVTHGKLSAVHQRDDATAQGGGKG